MIARYMLKLSKIHFLFLHDLTTIYVMTIVR